jgi:sugar lactone lactonase YvrE
MAIHPRQPELDVYASAASLLGEGPLWSAAEQALFWLDIGNKRLWRQGPSGPLSSWALPHYPGCLAELALGSIAIAMGKGLQRLDLQTGALQMISAVPHRRAGTRFNDGKVDPAGRLWVGTMQNNFAANGEPISIERTDGALYRLDPNGRTTTIEENIGVANTLAWSPNCKRFYFADSLRGQMFEYDFDVASGELRGKRMFFEAPDRGVPDGSAIDVEGCLWNARWDAGAVLRITPDGKIDRILELPVSRPTSCAFGGRQLDTLLITTARVGLTAIQLQEQPLAGSVLAFHGIAQGLAVPVLGFNLLGVTA